MPLHPAVVSLGRGVRSTGMPSRGIGPHAGLCSFLRSNRLSASLTEPIASQSASVDLHEKRPHSGTISTPPTMQLGGKRTCSEMDEMSKVDRQNSALHVSDNGYHIHSGCCQEDNFKNRCGCGDSQPDYHCNLCRRTGLTLAQRWRRALTLAPTSGYDGDISWPGDALTPRAVAPPVGTGDAVGLYYRRPASDRRRVLLVSEDTREGRQ